MNPSRLFILRPVATSLLMVAILLAGAVAYYQLPVSALPGVGLVSISGGQKPAVRVQANPTVLGSYGLTLEDLRTVIAQANVNQAKGNFDGSRQASTIGANDQLLTSSDYRALIITHQ